MEANSKLSRTTAVIAPSFKTFWFSMNWRVDKSNKTCLYFCKFNNFMFPRKPSWNFLYSLSQTDSQQGSSLFKKQVTLSTKSKTDELVHKSEQFNILNQKGLIICWGNREGSVLPLSNVDSPAEPWLGGEKPNCALSQAHKKSLLWFHAGLWTEGPYNLSSQLGHFQD